MEFQEAINLKINDEVFVIGKDNKVYPKRVTGVQLRSKNQVDITFINHTERSISNGYILAHQLIFLEEKYALGEILKGYLLDKGSIESKVTDIRKRIRGLDIEENKNADFHKEEAT